MKHKLHKLMAMFIASIFAVSAFAADIDVTSKVGTSKDAWKGNNGGPVNIDGVSLPEKYETTTATLGDVMWQTVTGLENGTYTVELYANARYTPGRDFNSDAADGALNFTYLYANNVEISIEVYHNGDLNNGKSYKLEGVEVTDGTLKMGMTKKAAGSNWHTIQIKSLTYHASDAVALAAAKVDLQAALDAANVVSPASDEFKAVIASAQNVYDNSQDVEEVKATTESLVKATKDARMANASLDNPVLTDFVVNGTFDTTTAPWQTTTNAQNKALASNQAGAFTGTFFENWNGSPVTGKIYQVIENIPNGLYELSICAFVNTLDATAQYVYANANKTALISVDPTAYTVRTKVTDGKIEIGFEQTKAVANWMGIDNVSLTYLGYVDNLKLYNTAKAEAEPLLNEKMSATALAALTAALAVEVNESSSDEDIEAATAGISAAMSEAKASIAAFAANKTAIDAMFSLMESTNVYTAEAFAAYSAKAEDFLAQYEAGTLTATVENPATIHGWHATPDYCEMLLSAFGIAVDDWANLHVNTWSEEGGKDGSEFKVPFYEYWVGDGESLGAATKTATVTGLVPGAAYNVEAWVRTRATNGVAGADATGITLSVGEGEAVDVTEGAVIGGGQFAHAVYTATGNADAEGNLKINFNILDGNNISWLSFKNLKYTAVVEEEPAAPKYYTIASYNRGGVLTDVNGAAHHVAVNENSYWYFVEADKNGGVNIINYNGRALNADLTISETDAPAVWYILPNGVNDLGVSISKTNPISNSSCIDANNKNTGVGTWAPSENDWDGCTWVIAEVDYAKDLEALVEANKDNHAKKPALGQYTTAAYEALVEAANTVDNPVDASKAINAFEGAKNLPYFVIEGAASYSTGKAIYDDPGNVNEKGNSHYFKEIDTTDKSMLWALDITETVAGVMDAVKIKNVGTGAAFWGCQTINITETDPSDPEDGIFLFYTTDNGTTIHAQDVGQLITRWNDKGAASGSAWKFTYVGNTYDLTALPEVDENDYTSYIVNADLSVDVKNDVADAGNWNTVGTKGISGGMVKVASESPFDFTQTISLPAGQYKMTAKAVYRYTGSEAEEFAAIEAGTKTRLVNLYAETATYKYEADVMNRYDGASDTDYAAGNGSVSVNGKFVPNSSSAVQTWFNNGQYVNELVFNVQEEGQVKIGLTRTGSIAGDYTNIGAWTLTRLGDAEADPKVEPEYLTVVGATAGDVAIVEGKATVESISSFEITFDRPVALAEDAGWAQLTDQWGDNSLKAEVLADNNCVVRFSLQDGLVITEAGEYPLYIPEGVVVDAENADLTNTEIVALITIEGGSVTPGASLNVTNVTVGEDVMEGFIAVATTEDMIKVNFDGQFYFQGQPSIVDENGDDASMAFDFMNGLDVDGSNSYIFMGKKAGIYTITLAKDQFNELAMMGWKAPAEDIVLTVQIVEGEGGEGEDVEITLSLNATQAELTAAGETFQLVATVTPEDAEVTIAWTSSDDKVATVDEKGLVTAVGEGMAQITATAGDKSVTCYVIVTIENTDTKIDSIDADAKAVIYDLSGRRVEKAVKGIYIINGKKVVIK